MSVPQPPQPGENARRIRNLVMSKADRRGGTSATPAPAPAPAEPEVPAWQTQMDETNSFLQGMAVDLRNQITADQEARTAKGQEIRTEQQGFVDQQMGNLQELAQNRSDGITQGGLAQMRQAAGMAGLAGQSLGGSFADAQRQVMLSTQGLQNDAHAQNLQAQQQLLENQANQAFSLGQTELGQQFQAQSQALGLETSLGQQQAGNQFSSAQAEADRGFRAGQADIDRGIDQSRYEDTLSAQAGETAATARRGLTDYSMELGRNPFEDDTGQVLQFGELDASTRDSLDTIAGAEGMSAEDLYNDMIASGATERYDIDPRQQQIYRQGLAAQHPIPPDIAGPLGEEWAEIEGKQGMKASNRDKKEYGERWRRAYNAVKSTGISEEEFAETYGYPLPSYVRSLPDD